MTIEKVDSLSRFDMIPFNNTHHSQEPCKDGSQSSFFTKLSTEQALVVPEQPVNRHYIGI
jgi:hypothetical protein